MTNYDFFICALEEREFSYTIQKPTPYFRKITIQVYEEPYRESLSLCFRFKHEEYIGHSYINYTTGKTGLVTNHPFYEIKRYIKHHGLRDISADLLKQKHLI